jgi:hypothetical protein
LSQAKATIGTIPENIMANVRDYVGYTETVTAGGRFGGGRSLGSLSMASETYLHNL